MRSTLAISLFTLITQLFYFSSARSQTVQLSGDLKPEFSLPGTTEKELEALLKGIDGIQSLQKIVVDPNDLYDSEKDPVVFTRVRQIVGDKFLTAAKCVVDLRLISYRLAAQSEADPSGKFADFNYKTHQPLFFARYNQLIDMFLHEDKKITDEMVNCGSDTCVQQLVNIQLEMYNIAKKINRYLEVKSQTAWEFSYDFENPQIKLAVAEAFNKALLPNEKESTYTKCVRAAYAPFAAAATGVEKVGEGIRNAFIAPRANYHSLFASPRTMKKKDWDKKELDLFNRAVAIAQKSLGTQLYGMQSLQQTENPAVDTINNAQTNTTDPASTGPVTESSLLLELDAAAKVSFFPAIKQMQNANVEAKKAGLSEAFSRNSINTSIMKSLTNGTSNKDITTTILKILKLKYKALLTGDDQQNLLFSRIADYPYKGNVNAPWGGFGFWVTQENGIVDFRYYSSGQYQTPTYFSSIDQKLMDSQFTPGWFGAWYGSINWSVLILTSRITSPSGISKDFTMGAIFSTVHDNFKPIETSETDLKISQNMFIFGNEF